MNNQEIVARARACVGVRFRPQGRDPATGLDCIGLAALATGVTKVRADYAMRGDHLFEIEQALRDHGFRPVEDAKAGDLCLFEAGPAQVHAAIFTGAGLIHADAGLRRVTERPGPFPWPLRSIWRLATNEWETEEWRP